MNSLPLHPAIVHLPLGLAMLMPALAAGFAWAMWTGRLTARAWFAIIALQGLLAGTAVLAINTGGAEEERVEGVVPEGALHQHEEFAEQFAWASATTGLLAALVLLSRRPAARAALTAGVVVATVAVAGLGLRVGHAGGRLVYVHGAASAYTRALSPPSEASSGLRRDAGRGDDTEQRERRQR